MTTTIVFPPYEGHSPDPGPYDSRPVSASFPAAAEGAWAYFAAHGDGAVGVHRFSIIQGGQRVWVRASVRVSPKTGMAWARVRDENYRIIIDRDFPCLEMAKKVVENEAHLSLTWLVKNGPVQIGKYQPDQKVTASLLKRIRQTQDQQDEDERERLQRDYVAAVQSGDTRTSDRIRAGADSKLKVMLEQSDAAMNPHAFQAMLESAEKNIGMPIRFAPPES